MIGRYCPLINRTCQEHAGCSQCWAWLERNSPMPKLELLYPPVLQLRVCPHCGGQILGEVCLQCARPPVKVVGTSMLPALQEGDWIVLAWGTERKPAPGQIIAFRDILRGITIAHRVIEVGADNKGWWARTRGQ